MKNDPESITSSVISASDVSSGASGGREPAGRILSLKQSSVPKPNPVGKRCAVYYDGFNLFHALKNLGLRNDEATGEKYLRWLNLWSVSEKLIDPTAEHIVKVVWCSAVYRKDMSKAMRHQIYKKALESVGVTCLMGHFVPEKVKHPTTKEYLGDKQTEKTSDVRLALNVICDGIDNVYDKAFLVTADTDQAATAEMFRARFQRQKELVTVAAFGRRHQQHILDHCDAGTYLTEEMVRQSLFPKTVTANGKWVVNRPPHYAPPIVTAAAATGAA